MRNLAASILIFFTFSARAELPLETAYQNARLEAENEFLSCHAQWEPVRKQWAAHPFEERNRLDVLTQVLEAASTIRCNRVAHARYSRITLELAELYAREGLTEFGKNVAFEQYPMSYAAPSWFHDVVEAVQNSSEADPDFRVRALVLCLSHWETATSYVGNSMEWGQWSHFAKRLGGWDPHIKRLEEAVLKEAGSHIEPLTLFPELEPSLLFEKRARYSLLHKLMGFSWAERLPWVREMPANFVKRRTGLEKVRTDILLPWIQEWKKSIVSGS